MLGRARCIDPATRLGNHLDLGLALAPGLALELAATELGLELVPESDQAWWDS